MIEFFIDSLLCILRVFIELCFLKYQTHFFKLIQFYNKNILCEMF